MSRERVELDGFVTEANQQSDLKAALNRALRALEKEKAGRAELVEAVYRAARDGIAALELSPVKSIKPRASRGEGKAEAAIPVLGDWQLGKVTPDYNSKVCEQRIGRYGDKIRRLTDIMRADHPVNEARVWMLGDMIEGITVFPGQAWRVDASLYRQITVDGPRIMGNFLRAMLSHFDRVHVTAVIGNHGRLGKRGDYDPESNGDRMLYRISQQLLAGESRLTWTIPDGMGESHWYAIDRIGNYSCLLLHGDQFSGKLGGGLTRLGVARAVGGWKAGGIPENFKDITFGHWHNNYEDQIADCSVRCNGSPESYNTFAQEALKTMSPPSQRFLFVEPESGIVTFEQKVWLR